MNWYWKNVDERFNHDISPHCVLQFSHQRWIQDFLDMTPTLERGYQHIIWTMFAQRD